MSNCQKENCIHFKVCEVKNYNYACPYFETRTDVEETHTCFNCKYSDKGAYEEPCNKCKHSYDNKFEWDISKYPGGEEK